MRKVKISDSKTIGKIMSAWGYYKLGGSAQVNAHKALMYHTELKNLERCDGFWRTPGCKSEFKDHARFLTSLLADYLSKYPDSIIFREHFISEIGLRADAIILLVKDGKGKCIILEAMVNETEDYLTQKKNVWKQWDGAIEHLSRLFGYHIKSFQVIGKKEG